MREERTASTFSFSPTSCSAVVAASVSDALSLLASTLRSVEDILEASCDRCQDVDFTMY